MHKIIYSQLFICYHATQTYEWWSLYQWLQNSQPFFHMLTLKHPDTILYTDRSGGNLKVSLDQSWLTPPRGQAS